METLITIRPAIPDDFFTLRLLIEIIINYYLRTFIIERTALHNSENINVNLFRTWQKV